MPRRLDSRNPVVQGALLSRQGREISRFAQERLANRRASIERDQQRAQFQEFGAELAPVLRGFGSDFGDRVAGMLETDAVATMQFMGGLGIQQPLQTIMAMENQRLTQARGEDVQLMIAARRGQKFDTQEKANEFVSELRRVNPKLPLEEVKWLSEFFGPEKVRTQFVDGRLRNSDTGEVLMEALPAPAEALPTADPRKDRKIFIDNTKRARESVFQTASSLALLDGARRAKARGEPGARLLVESALKAFIQAIDGSIVRESEQAGARQALGLWENLKQQALGAGGDVTENMMQTVENAGLALIAPVIPQIDSQVELFSSFHEGNAKRIITEYPERSALETIRSRIAERAQSRDPAEASQASEIAPGLVMDANGIIRTGVR